MRPRLLDPDVRNDHRYFYDWEKDAGAGEPPAASPKAHQTQRRMTWWREEALVLGRAADREAHLRRLWGRGIVAEVIGQLLGTTKDAVVGKADRLGLDRRDRRGRKGLGRRQRDALVGRADNDQRSDDQSL